MTNREKDEETTRRTARRLGLPERDLVRPDAVADLEIRIPVDQRIVFRRTPLVPLRVQSPPEYGEERLDRYPLERDRPPAMGDVPLETDVALGLDEDVHEAPSRRRRRDRRR